MHFGGWVGGPNFLAPNFYQQYSLERILGLLPGQAYDKPLLRIGSFSVRRIMITNLKGEAKGKLCLGDIARVDIIWTSNLQSTASNFLKITTRSVSFAPCM